MPTEKRQRQKEGRRQRLQAQRKVQKRRQVLRRTTIVVVVALVVVGSVLLFTHGSSTPPTTTTTSTTSAFAKAQAQVNAVAVKGGCPEVPATTSSETVPIAPTPANHLKWAHAPAMTIDTSKTYYAKIDTTQGPITAVLNTKGAPVNVNNFVFLAQKGFYTCNTFQRVIPTFMNQGGDGNGTGSPGYEVPVNEFPHKVASGKPQYPLGTIAIANSCHDPEVPASCPTSNGAQFFIVAGPEGESLPPAFTVVGRVLTGMGAVDRINKQGNSNPDDNGVPPDVINRILSVTITSR